MTPGNEMPEPKVRLEHTYLSEQTIVVDASPVASFVAEKIGCPKVSYLNEVLVVEAKENYGTSLLWGTRVTLIARLTP